MGRLIKPLLIVSLAINLFLMLRLCHESFVSTYLGKSNDNIAVSNNNDGGPYLNGLHIPLRSKSVFQQNNNPVNSAPGVTGPGIPSAIKKVIESTQVPIEEDASTFYAAENAVNALEEKCKWLPEETNFADKSCFSSVGFNQSREFPYLADPSLIDIVTPSIRNLDFLNQWRQFFQGFHIIIIQDGDPDKHLEIPNWVDYELYNRNDIVNATGKDHAWVISSKDASIRNFGFLVSKKPYIYTIDDDCLPAKDNDGNLVNPLAMHLRNLMMPSHPYFFNTLYDPYATGSDFVRGYPVSLVLLLCIDVCLNCVLIGFICNSDAIKVWFANPTLIMFLLLSQTTVFSTWRGTNSNQPRLMASYTRL